MAKEGEMAEAGPGPLRRERLDNFLSTLSPWDLLYIRRKFQTAELVVDGLATFADLPPELIGHIVVRLPLEAILRCRHVSRAWRDCLTHGHVVDCLSRVFLPGLVEFAKETGQDGTAAFFKDAEARLRRKLLLHRLKPSFIPWGAAETGNAPAAAPWPSTVELNDMDTTEPSFQQRSIHYHDGTLAWQPDASCAVIDNLHARSRLRCTWGHETARGRQLHVRGLSKKLLVFASFSAGGLDRLV